MISKKKSQLEIPKKKLTPYAILAKIASESPIPKKNKGEQCLEISCIYLFI